MCLSRAAYAPVLATGCPDSVAAAALTGFAPRHARDLPPAPAACGSVGPICHNARDSHAYGAIPRPLAAAAALVPPGGHLALARPPWGWSALAVPGLRSLLADSDKLRRLDALLARLHSGGHRVLIYSQMTRMLDLLEEYLQARRYRFLRLDGATQAADRRDMVADFQNRPDIFAFILSTRAGWEGGVASRLLLALLLWFRGASFICGHARAGGLGITLTAADTVIFYDR